MGISAAVASIASTGYAAKKAKDAEKRASKEREKQEAEMLRQEEAQKKKDEIAAAQLSASSPFSGNAAGRRIALERRQLALSSGQGRSGSVIRRTGTLG